MRDARRGCCSDGTRLRDLVFVHSYNHDFNTKVDTLNMPTSSQLWAWEKRGVHYLVHGVTYKGSTRYWNYLEDYWPRAGGRLAVNTICTQFRNPINSGLT